MSPFTVNGSRGREDQSLHTELVLEDRLQQTGRPCTVAVDVAADFVHALTHASLRSKGLFVFDLVCKTSAQPIFNVREFEGEGRKFSRTFVGIPTAEGFRSTMYYVVFDGASSEVIEETTLRGTFTEYDVLEALSDHSYTVLYVGGGYSTNTSVFVAQR